MQYPDAAAFLDSLGPLLQEREDENNLPLGAMIARRAATAAGFEMGPALLAHTGPPAAPGAILMMTPPFPLLIVHQSGSVEAVVAELIDALDEIQLPVHGVLSTVEIADAFRDGFSAATGRAIRETIRERLHRADAVEPVPIRPGRLIVASPDHFSELLEWVEAFHVEALPDEPPPDLTRTVGLKIEQGDYFLWEEDGVILGMAARARRTPKGICINSVYTPPQHRGMGVATSCVSELTRLLLEDADFCVLYTDLANPTSNALYRRIGYRPVRDFNLHWFEAPAGGPPTD